MDGNGAVVRMQSVCRDNHPERIAVDVGVRPLRPENIRPCTSTGDVAILWCSCMGADLCSTSGDGFIVSCPRVHLSEG